MKRTIILAILDGWGIGTSDQGNPIHAANPETVHLIGQNFPSCALQASGIAVGLPWGEEGNSEVGHLTIGTGRVFYQHFPRISLAIENGLFFKEPALKAAFAHARKNRSSVHLTGLLTDGNVHASFDHLIALLAMAERESCSPVLHLFTDGRDGDPHAATRLIERLTEETRKRGCGAIASIVGRYYAMDRDGHWDRTEKAYRLIFEGVAARTAASPEEAVKEAYAKNITDEFIEPTAVGSSRPVSDNDAVIFFNFREDRMRQLTETLWNSSWNYFPRTEKRNLFAVTMTPYDEQSPFPAVFPREKITTSLGQVLAENGKMQLRIAETEKYAHATYFLNGLREKPFPNEYRVLIPSQNIARHDEHPEMQAAAITDRALLALSEGSFDFIFLNYANPDIIAHTGNFEATVTAIQVVDREINRLLAATLAGDHVLIITSDHGNAEMVLNLQTGEAETKHNASPVPFYLAANELKKKQPTSPFQHPKTIGILSDVAPTILEIMHLPKPQAMTGQSILEELRRLGT